MSITLWGNSMDFKLLKSTDTVHALVTWWPLYTFSKLELYHIYFLSLSNVTSYLIYMYICYRRTWSSVERWLLILFFLHFLYCICYINVIKTDIKYQHQLIIRWRNHAHQLQSETKGRNNNGTIRSKLDVAFLLTIVNVCLYLMYRVHVCLFVLYSVRKICVKEK